MPQSVSRPSTEWHLPSSVTLGSSVRIKAIERELRRRIPRILRDGVTVEAGRVRLHLTETEPAAIRAACEHMREALNKVASLPVLPREAEDILSISSRERHKWLKDGRLQSIGTRSVKLRGRAKTVTFHVFDPRQIETILDADLPAVWRVDDAQAVVEGRRRAAAKAALARKNSAKRGKPPEDSDDTEPTPLDGWGAFEAEGLLR